MALSTCVKCNLKRKRKRKEKEKKKKKKKVGKYSETLRRQWEYK
jgi:hypothetical protein